MSYFQILILLFTSSSPCRKDQFAVSYIPVVLSLVGFLWYSRAIFCGTHFVVRLNFLRHLE